MDLFVQALGTIIVPRDHESDKAYRKRMKSARIEANKINRQRRKTHQRQYGHTRFLARFGVWSAR